MKAANGCYRAIQKVVWTLQHLLTVFTTQIIVRQHDNRRMAQVWTKQFLAGGVEIVAVHQRKNRRAHPALACSRCKAAPSTAK